MLSTEFTFLSGKLMVLFRSIEQNTCGSHGFQEITSVNALSISSKIFPAIIISGNFSQ